MPGYLHFPWGCVYTLDMNHTTGTTTTVTIAGREYSLGRFSETDASVMYEIIGKRGANGAIIVRKEAQYRGRAIGVGIAALERLNWWDISRALATHIPLCAEAVN